MSERARFDLALRLRADGAPVGEVFSFLSGLYFRGKLAYSTHFGRPPAKVAGQYIITSNAGLIVPTEIVSLGRLKSLGENPIDLKDEKYSATLRASVESLRRRVPDECEVVLLGSIATNKYSQILVESFGPQLMFPRDFIGRGDMSRGGLMLRAIRGNNELEYVSLSTIESRRGPRPPKLPNENRGQ